MREQLSLFNIDDAIEQTDVKMEQLEVENAHHTDVDNPVIKEPTIGQKIKLKLPEDSECEVYQYIIHYCSHLMKKVGVIVAIKPTPKGQLVCTVDFQGTELYFYPSNLQFI